MNKGAIAIFVLIILVGAAIAAIVITTKSSYTTGQVGQPLEVDKCCSNSHISHRCENHPCCKPDEENCAGPDISPPLNGTGGRTKANPKNADLPPPVGCICNGWGTCNGGTCDCGQTGLESKGGCTQCSGAGSTWNAEQRKCVSSIPPQWGPLTLCNQGSCVTLYATGDPGHYDSDAGYRIEIGTCYSLDATIPSTTSKGDLALGTYLKGAGGICSLTGVASIPKGYNLELYALSGNWAPPTSKTNCDTNSGPGVMEKTTLYSGNCPGNTEGTCQENSCTGAWPSAPGMCSDPTGCGFQPIWVEGPQGSHCVYSPWYKWCAFKLVKAPDSCSDKKNGWGSDCDRWVKADPSKCEAENYQQSCAKACCQYKITR